MPKRTWSYRVYRDGEQVVNEKIIKIFLDHEGFKRAISETEEDIKKIENEIEETKKQKVRLESVLNDLHEQLKTLKDFLDQETI